MSNKQQSLVADKAYSVDQFKGIDRRATESYGIPSIVLMENAGLRAADFIRYASAEFKGPKIVVACGRGNNGGDGFVVARHLINNGYDVSVLVLAKKKDIAPNAALNLAILEKMKAKVYFGGSQRPANLLKREISRCNLIVDAIFGIGLKRAIDGPLRSCISFINDSGKPVVSLDVPSGLDADTGDVLGVAVKATYTLTMAAAKKGFYINQGPKHIGELYIVDIGLPRQLLKTRR